MNPVIRDALAAKGLNLIGIADGAPYQSLLAGCKAVVVVASGGGALWDAFLDDLRADPQRLFEEDHPLDRFVARTLQQADPTPPASRRWIRCAADESVFIDFRKLALQAGLGWMSQLGVVLNPTFGPWMGLRAACLTTDALPIDGPLSAPAPCAACPDRCAAACPGGAFDAGRLRIRRCVAFRAASTTCAVRCDARRACPEGRAHAYGADALRYHMDPKGGREMLAQMLR
ncbi:MAG: hypothetical protein AAFV53_34600 [Myxococcota bacterium]